MTRDRREGDRDTDQISDLDQWVDSDGNPPFGDGLVDRVLNLILS
jgi:hypothetical protein